MEKVLYLFFVLLGMLPAYNSYGQQSLDDSLFQNFRNDVSGEIESYGRINWDDETRESYYLLMSKASVESLIKFTDDSIPKVRAEVFVGLAMKLADTNLLRAILNKHSNDTAIFTSGSACVVMELTVKGYMEWGLSWRLRHKDTVVDFAKRLENIKRDDFHLVLPGLHHGAIAKDSLLSIIQLKHSNDSVIIKSFDLILVTKLFKTKNIMTARIKRHMKQLKSGDKIYIENIKAEIFNDGVRTLMPLHFRIK